MISALQVCKSCKCWNGIICTFFDSPNFLLKRNGIDRACDHFWPKVPDKRLIVRVHKLEDLYFNERK
jgi:hypothetical protein